MTNEIYDLEKEITSLWQSRGFEGEIAQIQAKALLSEIAGEIPQYRWKYLMPRVIRNLSFGSFGIASIIKDKFDEADKWSEFARRAALVWESLAQLREGSTVESALLNAAVNYEIAGYQANAACVVKQLTPDNSNTKLRSSITQMSAFFLQRRFLQLTDIAKQALIEPEQMESFLPSLVLSLQSALMAKAFLQAIQYFFSGVDSFFDDCLKTLHKAEETFAGLGLVDETNIARSFGILLPVMKRRSTWTWLLSYGQDYPKWHRYLKLLARGLDTDVYKSRSVSGLWPSQIKAVQQGLLTADTNKIIRMPTSAGKTRVAEMAIVHTLVSFPGAKCIYVAPYRALVSELQQSFFDLLNDLGYKVSSIIGSFEFDDFEDSLIEQTDVLVTTPEKLDLLFRARPEFLQAVRLVVLDEAHVVHDYTRGLKYELLLTRLLTKLEHARFLTLSAVVSDITLEDFSKWFRVSSENGTLASEWRPSVQRYARFEWSGTTGVIRYEADDDIAGLSEFVPGVIRQIQFEYIHPDTGRKRRKRFPELDHKAQIAAELALKFAELGPVLVFCPQKNLVTSVAGALEERLELLRLSGHTIPHYFLEPVNSRAVALADEWLGNRPVTTWLKLGIGVHHGDLPDAVRNAVEADFKQRKLRVLIATNTLAQGVNLPVRTVIVHSCWRYTGGDSRERISSRDYWNIAGRAGRAGEETEGLIIHLALTPQDKIDYLHYLSERKNVEPVESALYQRLLGLVQGRLTAEGVRADIDAEILAMLVEESTDYEEVVKSILDNSLMTVQAKRNQISTEMLRQVFVDATKAILESVADTGYRRVYGLTGLSSVSCERIRSQVAANELSVRNAIQNGSDATAGDILGLVMPTCLGLSEMQSEYEFAGSYYDLLLRWIEGGTLYELQSDFAKQVDSPESLGQFIDDLFAYRLPWGIGGYIQVAAKVLEIERADLSDTAKFLPSMVKYGLPDPVSCWAMSAGIPSRRVAIEVAATFGDENPNATYSDFIDWLSAISPERLQYEFGLKGPLLGDVSKAIFSASRNFLLRQTSDINVVLPTEVNVQGIQYENRVAVALRAQVNQTVELIRDYDNLIDRNAIGVYLYDKMLGYLPRHLAQILSPEVDTGTQLRARVSRVTRLPTPKVSISIEQAAA